MGRAHMRRASEGADCWTVSKPFAKVVPATTRVLVRTDGEGACVMDDGDGGAGAEPKRGAARPAPAHPLKARARCAAAGVAPAEAHQVRGVGPATPLLALSGHCLRF